jgi:hypothetical protein
MEVSGQLHVLEKLYPQGKSPWYPFNRRLGGPLSRSLQGGEEKISQPLPGFEPSIIHPVAQGGPVTDPCERIKWGNFLIISITMEVLMNTTIKSSAEVKNE